MRKEVIFALILGSLLGGIILYGIKLANNAASLSNQGEPQEDNRVVTNPTPKIQDGISIITPEDHAVVFESLLPVKGTSKPGSTIVIVSDDDEKIIESDENGNFETEIDLVGGENNILFGSYSSDTFIASASVQIIYTTTVIE